MIGIKTARALVIDDVAEEAAGILEAFAKEGVGAAYLSGRVEGRPDQPFTGVRLMAVDMDLYGLYGQREDPREIVEPTVQFMSETLSKDNGPYLVIAWTSKPDLVAEFEKLVSTRLKCPPLKVIPIDKADVTNDRAYDLDLILEKVTSATKELYPFGIFTFWEQLVHDAASEVVALVQPKEDWPSQSADLLAALLLEASPDTDNKEVSFRSLLDALNALHSDALETNTSTNYAGSESMVSDLLTRLDQTSPEIENLKPELNRRLMLGRVHPAVAPGHLYLLDDQLQQVLGESSPKKNELIEDMRQVNTKDPEEDEKLRAAFLENEASAVPVAVEITPLCDYQQNNMRRARLVCGLAISPELEGKLRGRAEYVHKIGPLEIGSGALAGARLIALNSRYVFSGDPARFSNLSPLGRFRQSVLIEIQAWVARMTSRPGYLSIR